MYKVEQFTGDHQYLFILPLIIINIYISVYNSHYLTVCYQFTVLVTCNLIVSYPFYH